MYMDSGLVFLIDSKYGPLQTGIMNRKRSDGTLEPNEVPIALKKYNEEGMNGVDKSDQVRNGRTSTIMSHGSLKWTHRMFDGINEIAIANAYNIYRVLNPNEAYKHYFRYKFEADLANGMCSYRASNENVDINKLMGEGHGIELTNMWVDYTNDKGRPAKRRERQSCQQCPNLRADGKKFHRTTQYFCPACDVFLHPRCFAAYHKEKGFDIVLIDDVETFVTPQERKRR